ncbi:MAG: heparinase II/III family protein [Rhodovibrionaceae bacterium]
MASTAAPPRRKRAAAQGPGLLERFASLRRLPPEQLSSRVFYLLKQPVFLLPPYCSSLTGSNAAAPNTTPPDPWPGQAGQGSAIAGGCFALRGQTLMNPAPIWNPAEAESEWLQELHSFSWLRDLRAAGGDTARRTARELVGSWLDSHERLSFPAWDPIVLARRLSHWLGQWEFYAASADVLFRRRVIDSACRQACHLNRVLPAGLSGSDLICALKGLTIAGACLPGGERWLARGLDRLMRELPKQILVDGGHVERSPARQLAVLRDLIDLRATLHAAEVEVPTDLSTAIDAMAPTLRLFQHGDGGLALFNGSSEEEDLRIDMVLQRADGRGRPRMSAPQSGFQRMQAGRALVIVDSGAPPPPGYDRRAHAGTLSFEMSVGRERFIVNCGAEAHHPRINQLLRGTAAHSTLTASDTNSSGIAPGGGLLSRPETVRCRREEGEGNTWLDLSHDGYRPNYGLLYHRRLFLAANGEDLRGEERLDVFAESGTRPDGGFVLRFHLHPLVQANLLQDGSAALLRLPKGGGWRLKVKGAEIDLEDSLYLGSAGEQRRSQQVVLRGSYEAGETLVKWALQKEGPLR